MIISLQQHQIGLEGLDAATMVADTKSLQLPFVSRKSLHIRTPVFSPRIIAKSVFDNSLKDLVKFRHSTANLTV